MTDQLSRTFAALADPTRRAILARLAEGEATVNELAAPFPITVQAVSQHLKVLEQAGLIARSRTAQRRLSRFHGSTLKELDEWVGRYRVFWESSVSRWTSASAHPDGNQMADWLAQLHAAERGLVITWLFDAPPELVWREWTDPSRFAQWFGGAEVEVPLSSVVLDAVVGGVWTATTISHVPHGQETCWRGAYVEVVAPQRLAFTIGGLPGVPGPDLVTVTHTPIGEGRTEMLLRQQGQRTPQQYDVARELWSREFDEIARRLPDR